MKAKYNLKFIYHGHACFELKTPSLTLLFDPFLDGNEKSDVSAGDVFCDMILLSHAHSDHFGDVAAIAQRTNAIVIGVPEVLGLLPEGVHSHGMNLGGTVQTQFGSITMVPALHSSGVAGGCACGYVLSFTDGPTVYYAGDTALFGDMELIGRYFHIDYAVLPIGDNFTMGPDAAVEAAKMLHAGAVIPVHYNTWPVIVQDVKAFREKVEGAGMRCHPLAAGQALVLDLDIRDARAKGEL